MLKAGSIKALRQKFPILEMEKWLDVESLIIEVPTCGSRGKWQATFVNAVLQPTRKLHAGFTNDLGARLRSGVRSIVVLARKATFKIWICYYHTGGSCEI